MSAEGMPPTGPRRGKLPRGGLPPEAALSTGGGPAASAAARCAAASCDLQMFKTHVIFFLNCDDCQAEALGCAMFILRVVLFSDEQDRAAATVHAS